MTRLITLHSALKHFIEAIRLVDQCVSRTARRTLVTIQDESTQIFVRMLTGEIKNSKQQNAVQLTLCVFF